MKEPDPEVIKQLLVELRDVSKEKRRIAVMKLGMAGGDQATRALMATVQDEHEDLIVRGRAALMLGRIKDDRAVDALIRALTAPGYQTPLNAAEALGKIGDTRAIGPLLTLVASNNDRARDAALKALDRLGYNDDEQDTEEAVLETECEPN